MLSHVHLFATPWTVVHQAPLSVKFFRQEYWKGLPFPSPGHLPDPGTEPVSSALAGRVFTTSATCCLLLLSRFRRVLLFCNPMDCNPPGSSIHGILHGILEWVAIPSSRASSRPRDWTCVSYFTALADGFFTTSTTWEAW